MDGAALKASFKRFTRGRSSCIWLVRRALPDDQKRIAQHKRHHPSKRHTKHALAWILLALGFLSSPTVHQGPRSTDGIIRATDTRRVLARIVWLQLVLRAEDLRRHPAIENIRPRFVSGASSAPSTIRARSSKSRFSCKFRMSKDLRGMHTCSWTRELRSTMFHESSVVSSPSNLQRLTRRKALIA